jgi:hypothetical protein
VSSNGLTPVSQYRHDRFAKLYVKALYKTKGNVRENIPVRRDEDLAIDLLFVADAQSHAWQTEDLGWFDKLMAVHPTIIVEHYSGYLSLDHLDRCQTRRNLYWQERSNELKQILKSGPAYKEALKREKPFTWVLTVNCSQNTLRQWAAQPDPELGEGVYRLPPATMMGIVVLEELPAGSETLWLKMLSSGQSCQKAFSAIEQLSGSRRERNDILRVCAQYATYLQSRDPQELTTEEKAIMRTLEQIDTLFDVEIPAAERRGEERGLRLGAQQGKLQTIGLLVQAKFGDQPEIETILTRMAGLDETQLNAIATEIFQWQTLADIVAWLDRLES